MTTQYCNLQSIAGQATTPTTLQMQLFPIVDGVPDTTPDYTSDAVNAHTGVPVLYIGTFGETAVITGDYLAVLSRVSGGAVLATGDRTFEGVDGETARAAVLDSAGLTPEQQAQLDSIEARTNLITSATRVIVAADSGQNISLKIGDDFVAASNTAKRIEVNDSDSAIYDLLRDNTLTARAFGCGLSGKRDIVTGTIDRDTITHTAASGSIPAYTTVFVECSVDSSLQSAETGYDVQIIDDAGKKHTVFSGTCSLVTDYKS